LITHKGLDIEIQVDGNISYDTIPKVLEKGADMLVCGTSSLFIKDKSLEQALEELHEFLNSITGKSKINS
jgi:ribulose-phosphate 3-epimerase